MGSVPDNSTAFCQLVKEEEQVASQKTSKRELSIKTYVILFYYYE